MNFRDQSFRTLVILTTLVVSSVGIIIIISETLDISSYNYIFVITVSLSLMALLLTFTQLFSRSRYPVAHNIAIIGYPRSGKTSLITCTFGEIFANRVRNFKVTLRGENTIDRINQHLALIESGVNIGPTTDQDLFAYRADVEIPSSLFGKLYKIQIGDFPGEDSRIYSEEYGKWLHNTPFFRWALEADALVFIIDLGQYLISRSENAEYVAEISSAIRAAWQNYLMFLTRRVRTRKRIPISLTFTKSDVLLNLQPDRQFPSSLINKITEKAFSEHTPQIKIIGTQELSPWKEIVEEDFSDLIIYLRSETNYFSIVYTSCFGTHENSNSRFGIEDFFKSVLPSPRFFQ